MKRKLVLVIALLCLIVSLSIFLPGLQSVCAIPKCPRCGSSAYVEFRGYSTTPTCTTAGEADYICRNHGPVTLEYSMPVSPLGHNYKVDHDKSVPATCTEAGITYSVCSRCHLEKSEETPATGHQLGEPIMVEPTCDTEGCITSICTACGESETTVIAAKGHSFPEEWTVEKDSTIFAEGSEYRECTVCSEIEYRSIDRKPGAVAVIISSAGAIAAAGVTIKLVAAGKTAEAVKGFNASKLAKNAAKAAKKALSAPSVEEKTVVVCLPNKSFYKLLKGNKHLSVVEAERAELCSSIKENEPDFSIVDFTDSELKTITEELKAVAKENPEAAVCILVSRQLFENNSEALDKLVSDKLLTEYYDGSVNANILMTELVLPMLKPTLNSDESLENIGMVADLLGINNVSSIISSYISGRDVKDTIKDSKDSEDGLSFADAATIISDIASILGLDTVSSVAGLIGDIDDIKSSFDAKMGANEATTVVDAVKDIVEVTTDLIS